MIGTSIKNINFRNSQEFVITIFAENTLIMKLIVISRICQDRDNDQNRDFRPKLS